MNSKLDSGYLLVFLGALLLGSVISKHGDTSIPGYMFVAMGAIGTVAFVLAWLSERGGDDD